ncbi:hypothetical protein D9M68_814270 [compost metagenome]
MSYDLAILRQEENHYLSLPIDRIRQLPVEVRRLLGWSRSVTFMGWVEADGQQVDPQQLLQQEGFREVGMID